MIIRKANENDLIEILNIVSKTREYFKKNHIPQWQNEYPSLIDFKQDIKLNRLFVLEEKEIIGMFVVSDYDHNYDYIEDGKWLDNSDYVAIHRLAIKEDYRNKGCATFIFNYLKNNYDHIRVDTHKDNIPMNNLLKKLGFVYCGIVYMEDKTKRNAYEIKSDD